jgi:hypothetical protein
MKNSEVVQMLGLFLGIVLLFAPEGRTQSKEELKRPVITKYYATDRGRYGTIWKIYIEAEAGEAEMSKMAVVVEQPGQGYYPADFILLDPQHRNHLKGYLQWNTFSSKGAVLKEREHITLRASVIDKAGIVSEEVIFPFTFVSGAQEEAGLPAPFDQGSIPRIGFISIDLIGQDSGS